MLHGKLADKSTIDMKLWILVVANHVAYHDALAETQVKRNCCLSLALSLPADRLQSILPATSDEQYRTEAKSRSFSALTGVAVIRARSMVLCSVLQLGLPLLCVVTSVSVYSPYTITIINMLHVH